MSTATRSRRTAATTDRGSACPSRKFDVSTVRLVASDGAACATTNGSCVLPHSSTATAHTAAAIQRRATAITTRAAGAASSRYGENATTPRVQGLAAGTKWANRPTRATASRAPPVHPATRAGRLGKDNDRIATSLAHSRPGRPPSGPVASHTLYMFGARGCADSSSIVADDDP